MMQRNQAKLVKKIPLIFIYNGTQKKVRVVKHKRSKSSNSRINKNNFISNSRGNFKLSNMNTVPQLAKLTETNDNYLQPKFIYYPPRLFTLFFLGSVTSFVIDHLLT